MSDFTIDEKNVLKKYTGRDKHVNIPYGVKKIDWHAFSYNTSIVSVVIPASVTRIYMYAFRGCTSLASIEIPDSVREIGFAAFEQCTSLKSVTIPPKVTSIESRVFENCENLETIVFKGQLAQVSASAFRNCKNLRELLVDPAVVKDEGTRLLAYASWLNEPDKLKTVPQMEEIVSGALAKSKEILPIIFRYDMYSALRMLFARGKIKKARFDEEYLNPAISAKAVQCVAFLVEWKSSNITPEYEQRLIEREFMRDPFNAADMKKSWGYRILEDGTCELTTYKGKSTSVVVPCRIGEIPVSSIGDGALSPTQKRITKEQAVLRTQITDIDINDGIAKIGNNAFNGCEKLKNINFPDGIVYIGNNALRGCRSIDTVIIPNSVASIGDGLLDGCENLVNITLPDSACTIGNNMFRCCSNLTKVKIPEPVKCIGENAFSGCTKLRGISDLDNIVRIGADAFHGCSDLMDFKIPESLEDIGDCAFYGCKGLDDGNGFIIVNRVLYGYTGGKAKVKIPSVVTCLASKAFYGCGQIEEIETEGTITEIRSSVFEGCDKLHRLALEPSLIEGSDLKLLTCLSWVDTPEWVENNQERAGEIVETVINKRKKLLPVILGNDMTLPIKLFAEYGKITKSNIDDYLSYATNSGAKKCIEFLSEWKSQNMTAEEIEKADWRKANRNPLSAGELKKIWSCSKLPDGTLKITSYKGTEKSVSVPDRIGKVQVTEIGDYALSPRKKGRQSQQSENLINLETIVIPAGVERIGEGAFSGCDNLTKVSMPDTVRCISDSAFFQCIKLDEINISESVTFIGFHAFCGCGSLTSIQIPESVEHIGKSAFSSCLSLKSVNLFSSAAVIEDGAFYRCQDLESVTIPDTVHEIGNYAFAKCTNLAYVRLSETLNRIGDSAFKGCTNITDLLVPNSVKNIEDKAFKECRSLESITLPGDIEFIGRSAFSLCGSLNSVIFKERIPPFEICLPAQTEISVLS